MLCDRHETGLCLWKATERENTTIILQCCDGLIDTEISIKHILRWSLGLCYSFLHSFFAVVISQSGIEDTLEDKY